MMIILAKETSYHRCQLKFGPEHSTSRLQCGRSTCPAKRRVRTRVCERVSCRTKPIIISLPRGSAQKFGWGSTGV